ncbi:MAG: response regulator transcription factor [Bacteroidales bacterium]|nr:response regulator transcription factor [Bacteroidales bacterium]
MENNEYRVLLVDDEDDVLEFLSYNLIKENYNVFTAKNGEEALKLAESVNPHLVILDVMMPGMDGIETCRELKQINLKIQPLILFLTARSEDYSQIAGFEAGGDDYVSKPIKPRVLVSRIKALLRRHKLTETDAAAQVFLMDDLIIDKEKYVVIINNKEIMLPKKEFELLALLTSKPNKVFSRDEIFARVWGDDVVVGDRTIDVHIRKIREKLNIDNIKTIKGVGYKYER